MPMDMHIKRLRKLLIALIAALLSFLFLNDSKGDRACQEAAAKKPIKSLGNYAASSNPPARYQASSKSTTAP